MRIAPSDRWRGSSVRRCRCGSSHGGGNRASQRRGLGKVLRFGANSSDVLERLRWLGTEFFAAMQVAVRGLADADLKPLMAQALHMGDELHNRNAAASGLLFKRLTLSLLGSKLDSGIIKRALAFVAGNDHFFLNLSMAAWCRCRMPHGARKQLVT
jgi:hypothetical protein